MRAGRREHELPCRCCRHYLCQHHHRPLSLPYRRPSHCPAKQTEMDACGRIVGSTGSAGRTNGTGSKGSTRTTATLKKRRLLRDYVPLVLVTWPPRLVLLLVPVLVSVPARRMHQSPLASMHHQKHTHPSHDPTLSHLPSVNRLQPDRRPHRYTHLCSQEHDHQSPLQHRCAKPLAGEERFPPTPV